MRSFFVGWAARLGRLLATRGLGAEDGAAPVVQHRLPCVSVSAPYCPIDLSVSGPVPPLDLSVSVPYCAIDLSVSAPRPC